MKDRIAMCRLITLLAIPFIWALSNSMIIPVLPRIQETLGITKVQSGLIITALSLPTALLLPLAGFLSDRYGRINVMIPAIFLYGTGGLLAGFAGYLQSFPLLLIARGVQGIGATGTTLLAMSCVGDIYQDKRRVQILGYLEATNSIGKLTSPLLGTAAAAIVWFAPFFVYPLLAYPIVVGLWFLRRNVPKHTCDQKLPQYFKTLWNVLQKKGGSFIAAFFTTFIAVFLWFGNLFFLSEVMANRFGIGGFSRGLLLSLPIATLAITAVLSGKFLYKLGLVRLTSLGLVIMAVTLGASLVLPDRFLIYGTVAFVGVGLGMVLPSLNTLIVSSVAENERGVVAASYGSVRSLGSALGPIAFGWGMGLGDTLLLLLAALLGLLAAGIGYFFIKESIMLQSSIKNKPEPPS